MDAKLDETLSWYETLVESIEAGICISELVFDATGQAKDFRIVKANPAFRKVLELGDMVVEGKNARELVANYDQGWLEIYTRVVRSRRPENVERFDTGRCAWYSERVLPLGRPEQNLFAIIFEDVTEQKRLEEDLKQAQRKKDRFMAMLSHELRNPLAPMKLNLELMEMLPPESSEARQALMVIERQVDQLTRLLDDLLDVTRVARNKIRLQKMGLEFGELARGVIEDHRSLFERKGVALSVEMARAPLGVRGDANRLAQVLGNLLQNAVKFTPSGGHVDVEVFCEEREGQVIFRVRDNGVGLDEKTMQELFVPFTQADATLAHTKGGLGLGLALVRGLMKLHGGGVRAHSDGPNKGACFEIWLPQRESVTMTSSEARVPKAPPRRVLLIEDQLDVAESLRQILMAHGHEVSLADNGEEGITKALSFEPDVVFCDIGLPGRNGFEVAGALRDHPQLRSLYLVALSGYALPEDIERSLRAGFNEHIAKPPDFDALQRAIERAGQTRDRARPLHY